METKVLAKDAEKPRPGPAERTARPHRTRVRPVELGSIVTLMRHASMRDQTLVMLMIVHVCRAGNPGLSVFAESCW